MLHYLKYLFKLYFGFMIIVALNTMLHNVHPFIGDFWFFITLILYCGYCYIGYRITDKED